VSQSVSATWQWYWLDGKSQLCCCKKQVLVRRKVEGRCVSDPSRAQTDCTWQERSLIVAKTMWEQTSLTAAVAVMLSAYVLALDIDACEHTHASTTMCVALSSPRLVSDTLRVLLSLTVVCSTCCCLPRLFVVALTGSLCGDVSRAKTYKRVPPALFLRKAAKTTSQPHPIYTLVEPLSPPATISIYTHQNSQLHPITRRKIRYSCEAQCRLSKYSKRPTRGSSRQSNPWRNC
jgi:hypothetical protein